MSNAKELAMKALEAVRDQIGKSEDEESTTLNAFIDVFATELDNWAMRLNELIEE